MAIDPSVKKILNNGTPIAVTAGLLKDKVKGAETLAAVAGAYRDLLEWLRIDVPIADFEGCEQARLIMRWYRGKEPVNFDLMREWTDAIADGIEHLLAHGKLP